MRAAFLGAVVATMLGTSLAHADPSADADTLFKDGNTLAAAGKYAEACPKLAESQKLDPAVGTEFNLADCYEHLDRLATAYSLFVDVQKVAHAAGKFEREKRAKERADALGSKIGKLKLVVQATAPGLEVKVDDIEDHGGGPIAIDAGTHAVVATAPGRTTWTGSVTTKDGDTTALTIPELVDPNPAPPPQPIIVVKPAPAPPPPKSTQKTLAYVAGGVGVAGIAVGAIAGAIAISKKGSANDICASSTYHFHCPTQAGADAWSSAQTAGNVSSVGFIVGGALLAAGIVLWITAPSNKPVTTAWAF